MKVTNRSELRCISQVTEVSTYRSSASTSGKIAKSAKSSGGTTRSVCIFGALALFSVTTTTVLSAPNLLLNGDFNASSILGTGQSDLTTVGTKEIQPDSGKGNFLDSVSGIQDWTYRTPESYGSDHGPAIETAFGNPSGERMVYINNWNRMMSQQVSPTLSAGMTAFASIQFGTLGSAKDAGRAGTFYLVAGGVDLGNADLFASDAVILDSITVGNPAWNRRKNPPANLASVRVGEGVLTTIGLHYTFQVGDPALTMPLTVAFRTEDGSVGMTYWDNASLSVVPEPSTCFAGLSALGMLGLFGWRHRK